MYPTGIFATTKSVVIILDYNFGSLSLNTYNMYIVMNHDIRTLSFLFSLSIFRTDLHNQRSHIEGHIKII